MVYAEALAHGLPVVATQVGGAEEMIQAGETGLLVPAGDVDALADAAGRVLADHEMRMRMGAAARRRVETEFTLDGIEMTRDTNNISDVISGMTFGTQILKSNLLQLSKDLEDASRVVGASWQRFESPGIDLVAVRISASNGNETLTSRAR